MANNEEELKNVLKQLIEEEKNSNNELKYEEKKEKREKDGYIKSVISNCYATIFHLILIAMLYWMSTITEETTKSGGAEVPYVLFIITLLIGILPHIIFELMGIVAISEYYKTNSKNKSLDRKVSNALNIINLITDVILIILFILQINKLL